MKRIAFTALIALFLANSLVFAQGSKETGSAPENELEEIQARGTVRVAMEGNWRPWSYHDEENNLVGYDADVARAVAEKLGVQAEFTEAPWESLFAGVDAGRYDMVVNGVEITDERSQKYDFSVPYGYIHTVLIVRSDNETIKSFEDLKGKKTANSIASTYMTLAESYGATAEGVSTLDETLMLVQSGRVDATLNAEDSFLDYMSVHPDAPLKVVAKTSDPSRVAIPLRKGEDELRAAVDKAIEELRADGTLAELSEKYFGSDISRE